LEIAHLPAHLFPDLEKKDLATQSLYAVIEKFYGVQLGGSEEELEAVPAKEDEA